MSLFDTDAFNRALFYPQPITSPAPAGAEDVRVGPERLHLRIYGPPSRAVLLLFHGNGEVVADYDELAPRYAEKVGVSLAVMDYRGYGQSGGVPTLRSAIADAQPVLDAVIGRGLPVIVMGRSLGGALAAELCKVERPEVKGFVFESAPSNLEGIVARRGIRDKPTLEDRAVFDPLPKMARCKTPALVMHGEEDALISIDEAVQTMSALPNGRLVRIPGRGHNDVSEHPLYWEALGEFVQARFRRRSSYGPAAP